MEMLIIEWAKEYNVRQMRLLKVIWFSRSIGWRLGLQALTGVISTLFVLGTFYRSASLYHPQRRAILHLKSQKRKIKSKDKEKTKTVTNSHEDTPPFFDFSTLKSRTVQILLLSTSMAGLGLNTPLLFMVNFKSKLHSEKGFSGKISFTFRPNKHFKMV